MIDQAAHLMAGGREIALERIHGVNDNMTRSHYHEYFELYYLEAGGRFHMTDDRLHELGARDLIIFPPYVMHHSYGAPDVGFRRVVLYFTPDSVTHPEVLRRLRGRENTYRTAGRRRIAVDTTVNQLLASQNAHEELFEHELRLLLNQLLIQVVRTEPTDMEVVQEHRMSQIIRYLHDHHDESIMLEDLAEQFFISQYHLCREFKKYTSRTVVSYLNNVRIGRAQRLLNETDLSIVQVSRQVGFANVTHFNRVFRSVTGMSPSESRRVPTGSENNPSAPQTRIRE